MIYIFTPENQLTRSWLLKTGETLSKINDILQARKNKGSDTHNNVKFITNNSLPPGC